MAGFPPFPSHRLLVRVELSNCITDAPFNQPVRFDNKEGLPFTVFQPGDLKCSLDDLGGHGCHLE